LSAGRLLIEVRDRLSNRQAFQDFLRDHCGGLSQSRAYEYIGMAEGRTTADETRAKTNERKHRHRAKKAAGTRSPFRSRAGGTESAAGATASARDDSEKGAPASPDAERSAEERKAENARAGAEAETHEAESSADPIAEVKFAIDRWFAEMDNAGRVEIASYISTWSPDAIPDFLRRPA
jgi:hypothetical protein